MPNNRRIRRKKILTVLLAPLLAAGCYNAPEMTLEEIAAARAEFSKEILAKTVSKPRKDDNFAPGKVGGVWNGTISGDPKSFNMLVAEADAATTGVLAPLTCYFADYDINSRGWKGCAAEPEISVDEARGTMDVKYTLRSNLYWSYYGGSKPKVKVTSDDVIFWYDEIQGDQACASSAYNSQFMPMEDGSLKRITIEKIDENSFVFHFPRIVAEPLLSTNSDIAPSFLYRPIKERGGAAAVRKFLTVETDPREIPSCGPYFLTEYTPGQRIVYQRNPDYWDKDSNGESHYYPETKVFQIVSDANTELMLFKQGKVESFSPSPEQLDGIISGAENGAAGKEGYTVFNAAGSMGASFWSFNQNPKNKDEPFYQWFVRKEFRQAMSCLLNRERIIQQTYRGLAEPAYYFFPEANKYFNPSITLEYKFSHEKARSLLKAGGFAKREDGFLYDDFGRRVEFDLTIISNNPTVSDISQIIADECKKEGIVINVRQMDFQKVVEQLMSTYDWQSLIIGLSGGSIFPTQGSNVWVSDGNLHLWHPLQKSPATDWEARIDFLYHEAACIPDAQKAAPLWDEYQRIFLEQCPVIYLLRPRTFFALQNRWDMGNVFYDNMYGATTEYAFLKD